MRYIDKQTFTDVHNALDNLTLGNFEMARKQLNDIVTNKELTEEKKPSCNCSTKCEANSTTFDGCRYFDAVSKASKSALEMFRM
jgi:hypothetical protein